VTRKASCLPTHSSTPPAESCGSFIILICILVGSFLTFPFCFFINVSCICNIIPISLKVFRTSASYKRWNEARKIWGITINHMRDVTRMASAWYGSGVDEDDDCVGGESGTTETAMTTSVTTTAIDVDDRRRDPEATMRRHLHRRRYLLGQVSLMTWAFVRSMKRHLSPPWEDEDDFRDEVRSRLHPDIAESLICAGHRPYRARFNLCLAIESVSTFILLYCIHRYLAAHRPHI
jgi:hypothetical protein